MVWLGCAVLVIRGGTALIDDLTRAVGLLPNGITGLSHKQAMGAAYYRSASALWSANVTDAYFFAGGLLFGLLATATVRDIKVATNPSARPEIRGGRHCAQGGAIV